MNDIGKSPAVAQALKFLRLNLQNGTWPPGCRLPVHKALAEMSGISQSSLGKALAILKREELVTTIPGGWIMAGKLSDAPVPPPEENPDRKKWQRVKRQLERDIFAEEFAAGRRLPPFKTLAEKYDTVYHTLKKAVSSLVDDGILVGKRTRARVFHALPDDHQSQIILLGQGSFNPNSNHFLLLPSHPIEAIVLRELDLESQRKNIILTPICFGPSLSASLGEIKGKILGVVVIPTPDMSSVELGSLLSNHIGSGLPICIFDADGGLHKNLADFSNRRIRFFRLAGASSGRAVGEYLLSMGHRRIACISQFSREKFRFVAERFAGLVSAWRAAHLPISHITFRCPESIGLTPAAPPDVIKSMANPENIILTPSQMEWIFDELRQDPEITAWVTINDNLMVQLIDYCGNTPWINRISIVSFDDLLAATYLGVTSFNFNVARLADAMLAAILSPPHLGARMANVLIEQPGQIVVRRSFFHILTEEQQGSSGIS